MGLINAKSDFFLITEQGGKLNLHQNSHDGGGREDSVFFFQKHVQKFGTLDP